MTKKPRFGRVPIIGARTPAKHPMAGLQITISVNDMGQTEVRTNRPVEPHTVIALYCELSAALAVQLQQQSQMLVGGASRGQQKATEGPGEPDNGANDEDDGDVSKPN